MLYNTFNVGNYTLNNNVQILPKASYPPPATRTVTIQGPVTPPVIPPVVIEQPSIIYPTWTPTPPKKLINSNDQAIISTKKFTPFEILTGISQQRPVIIMMTNLLPLYEKYFYDKDNNRISMSTNVGDFFKAQININALKIHNIKHLLLQLKTIYSDFKIILNDRKIKVDQQIKDLNDIAIHLYRTVNTIEISKARLNLRDKLYVVDPYNCLQTHISQFNTKYSPWNNQIVASIIGPNFNVKYDIIDCLTKFGYQDVNVRSKYSSTKIWFQLLFETKQALKTHTNKLTSTNQNHLFTDTSASKLSLTNFQRFEYSQWVPTVPSLSELKNINSADVNTVIDSLNDAYKTLYTDIHFSNSNQRIAALCHLISKEYRYSYGLSQDNVKQILTNYYQYQISNSNLTLFDYVIGSFGTNITDVVTQTKTLVSIAQQTENENVILPFESSYIESDSITTPGSDYYIDDILNIENDKYNTTRIKDLQFKLHNAYKNFQTLISGFNLLSISQPYDTNTKYSNAILNDSKSLFMFIYDALITNRTFNDVIISLFTYSENNNILKSLLFTYLVCRASRVYASDIPFFKSNVDTTPVVNDLIDKIMIVISKQNISTNVISNVSSYSFINERTKNTNVNDYSYVELELIRTSLEHGTTLLITIEKLFGQILSTFQDQNNAFNNSTTRFGGYLDTTIMMSVFDVIVSIISSYGNEKFVGIYDDNKILINHKYVDFTYDKMEVVNTLNRENTLLQHALFSINTVLFNLSNSLNNDINYYENESTIKYLNKILSYDVDIKTLFNEQQINLLTSRVADLFKTYNIQNNESIKNSNESINPYDDNDLKILESLIGPKIQNAISNLFTNSEYTQLNNKIFTVGIPHGFSKKLERKIDLKTIKDSSFINDKQKDIIKICVYKTDMLNSDLIFLPQKFLFEISRFVVKSESLIKSYNGTNIKDLINSFPTRNSVAIFDNQIQFLNPSKNELPAFDDSYVLTNEQRYDLYKNHVIDYLLSIYIKMLTGNDVSENTFNVIDKKIPVDTFAQTLFNYYLNYLSDNKQVKNMNNGVFFTLSSLFKGTTVDINNVIERKLSNPSGMPGLSQQQELDYKKQVTNLLSTDVVLSKLSAKDVDGVTYAIRIIDDLISTITNISMPEVIANNIIQPKKFERIFNIVFDANQFEIDTKKTLSTAHGKENFDILIKRGEVIPLQNQQTFANLSNRWKIRDKNVDNDLLFDKYFVSIETLDGVVV
jgi:hypothetical protein